MNEERENPKLERALRGMAPDRIFVPPQVDEKVLEAVREHFENTSTTQRAKAGPAKRPPSWRKRSPWQRWMPLAASIAMAGMILYFSRPIPDQADLNRDGTVDIIDALLLAEQLSAGAGKDIDGDESITEADAAEIASRAVALERTRL